MESGEHPREEGVQPTPERVQAGLTGPETPPLFRNRSAQIYSPLPPTASAPLRVARARGPTVRRLSKGDDRVSFLHRGREVRVRTEHGGERLRLAAGLAVLLGGGLLGVLLYGRQWIVGATYDELVMGAGLGVLLLGTLWSLLDRGRGVRAVRVVGAGGAARTAPTGVTVGGGPRP